MNQVKKKKMSVTSNSYVSEIDNTDSDPDFFLGDSDSSLAVSSMDERIYDMFEKASSNDLSNKKGIYISTT